MAPSNLSVLLFGLALASFALAGFVLFWLVAARWLFGVLILLAALFLSSAYTGSRSVVSGPRAR